MTGYRIDLLSDTCSTPSPAMRQAMAAAAVGDEQRNEDPTVNLLCERVAGLLGKESALFLPSGTMCNLISLLVHCGPGDEIIAADTAHIDSSEGGGYAVFAGATLRAIPTGNGIFDADDVANAIRAKKMKAPKSRLVALEQTSNRGGGSVWPLAQVERVAAVARQHGLSVHMDGARLLNAAVASGVTAAKFAAPCDSVWLDLSKGLGCPFGGVLTGSKSFIDDAWVWKHRLGGAMRQGGIMAAAGVYALEHNVERLATDHENARLLAKLISVIPGIAICNPAVETNLVFFEITRDGLDAAELVKRIGKAGVRVGVEAQKVMRAVTHIDIDRAGVEAAAAAIAEAVRA